jgi:hypothetical protein
MSGRGDRRRPATVPELRARTASVITDRLQAGRPLTAKWLGEAAGISDGGALKFLREQVAAGRLACRRAPGAAPYRDTYTSPDPTNRWPTSARPSTPTTSGQGPSGARPALVATSPATRPPQAVTTSTRVPAIGAAPTAPTAGAGRGPTGGRDVFRVLITGSRTWTDAAVIARALADLHREYGDRLVVVHGACRTGADRIADGWARRHGVRVEAYPADWVTGRGAGPARNARMVDTAPAACLAFIRDGSAGATGCADLAEQAGVRTTRHTRGIVARERVAPPGPAPLIPAPAVADTAAFPGVEPAREPAARMSGELPDLTDVLFADLDLVGR